jgi:hypothetical protein
MSFHALPDAIVKHIASFLPVKELCHFEQLDRRTRAIDTDEIWRKACENRWRRWPRYKLTPSRLRWIEENLPNLSWKRRYAWGEGDASRTRMMWEELESLSWFFNFTPQAGGRGNESLRKCRFSQGMLFLPQYLPMPYRIEVSDGVQFLCIYHFPPHRIERLPCCAEWIMTNENVTFVSSDQNDTLTYAGRGFQGNNVANRGVALMDRLHTQRD